jgi:hypothetical protein
MWLIRKKSVTCSTWETNIPNSYERKLVMLNESCEGISSSDVVSIELTNARDATPVFHWVNRNVLEISINKISYLKHRTNRVDDVQIHLHIGEVEFK